VGVFVNLGIQHAMCMCHIAVCGLTLFYNIFPHYLTNGTIFGKKVIEQKMCVLSFSITFV